MDHTEKLIREKALLRLSRIFGISIADLSLDRRFGEDLKGSFVSDFRRNELDKVSDDIHDVADSQGTKEMASGTLTIRTVGDYCDHMVRCSKTRQKDVERLLGIN